MRLQIPVLILFSLFQQSAFAGMFEASVTGSYKKNHFNEQTYSTTTYLTGSLAYYFWTMSALELSYTQGEEKSVFDPESSADPKVEQRSDITILSADIVFSLAPREAVFQPYVKAGIARISQTIFNEIEGFPEEKVEEKPKAVPSFGVGTKVLFTQDFALKVGYETWGEKFGENASAKVGLSLLF